MARTSSTALNRSGESGHPFRVPDIKEEAFYFLPLSMVLAVSFSHMSFIMLRYILSISNLLRVFNHEKILNFVKCFYASIENTK